MNTYIKVPQDIEKRSFEIIGEELGDKINKFDETTLPVIKRVIHTTADFEYADLIEFMNDAINSGKEALKNGCKIYCDTNMIVNGASKMVLSKFNCEAYCLVADSEVAKEAISAAASTACCSVVSSPSRMFFPSTVTANFTATPAGIVSGFESIATSAEHASI